MNLMAHTKLRKFNSVLLTATASAQPEKEQVKAGLFAILNLQGFEQTWHLFLHFFVDGGGRKHSPFFLFFNDELLESFQRFRDAGAEISPAFLKTLAAWTMQNADSPLYPANGINSDSKHNLTYAEFVAQKSFVQRWRSVRLNALLNKMEKYLLLTAALLFSHVFCP